MYEGGAIKIVIEKRGASIESLRSTALENSLPVYVFIMNFNLAKHLFNISTNGYTENLKLDMNREKFWLHSWVTHEQIVERKSRRSFTGGFKDDAKLCCTAGVPNNPMVRMV
ncbi:hypothetical protein TNCV_1179231 [Trichonephila clavipes]|nr:hypothetical protein TNCV_1179231 [Trichonephila clavipes]